MLTRKYILHVVAAAVIILSIEMFGHFVAKITAEKYADAIMLLVVSLGIILLYFASRKGVQVDFEATPLLDDVSKKRFRRKGLIIFLSLYNELGPQKLSVDQIAEAAGKCDYATLHLDDTTTSSLGHQITAVKLHSSNPDFQHCWIVSTRAMEKGKRQSLDYVPVFKKYVEDRISAAITIHSGVDYSILLDDDTNACRNTYSLIKKIYREAKDDFGLQSKDLITDVTGGFRAITIGALLGCLRRDEDVEYIGATYDLNGNPTSDVVPFVVQYQSYETEIE